MTIPLPYPPRPGDTWAGRVRDGADSQVTEIQVERVCFDNDGCAAVETLGLHAHVHTVTRDGRLIRPRTIHLGRFRSEKRSRMWVTQRGGKGAYYLVDRPGEPS